MLWSVTGHTDTVTEHQHTPPPECTRQCATQLPHADALTACCCALLSAVPLPPDPAACASNASAALLPDAMAASNVALSLWSPHTYSLPPRDTGRRKLVGGLWLGCANGILQRALKHTRTHTHTAAAGIHSRESHTTGDEGHRTVLLGWLPLVCSTSVMCTKWSGLLGTLCRISCR